MRRNGYFGSISMVEPNPADDPDPMWSVDPFYELRLSRRGLRFADGDVLNAAQLRAIINILEGQEKMMKELDRLGDWLSELGVSTKWEACVR
jgi:hypothetical protein